ncbi:hypothetical protein GCM10025859_22570 [Alicyclobacillus fastidiosus]|nr:hypothetical protein GCM10025859_22570 [Alicyclobacillus fastidiosus]
MNCTTGENLVATKSIVDRGLDTAVDWCHPLGGVLVDEIVVSNGDSTYACLPNYPWCRPVPLPHWAKVELTNQRQVLPTHIH